eukprot:2949776-Rhodomonas_salina.1
MRPCGYLALFNAAVPPQVEDGGLLHRMVQIYDPWASEWQVISCSASSITCVGSMITCVGSSIMCVGTERTCDGAVGWHVGQQVEAVGPATPLRACYAMPGTDAAPGTIL